MGIFLSRAQDQGIMDIVRKHMSYKCFGTEGSKICNSDFTWMHPSVQSIHLQMDNVFALSYLAKIWKYSQQSSLRYKLRDLGLLVGQRVHVYSKIPSMCSQQGNCFPVASSERLKRIEIGFQSFSNNMQEVGGSKQRSFCFQNLSSDPDKHFM